MDQVYRFLWFPRHYKLIIEAVNVAIDRLRNDAGPANQTVVVKLEGYVSLHGMLTSHMPAKGAKPYHEQLGTEQLRQIKTALLLYLPILEANRDKIILESNDLKGATEIIGQKIEIAKKLLNEKALVSLNTDTFPSGN